MDRNTPFEEHMDDWVRGAISYETLQQAAQQEGINDLEEQCRLHKAAYNGLRDFQLMQRIAGIGQMMDGEEKKVQHAGSVITKLMPVRRWFSIAASVLVLAVLYYVVDSVRMSPGLLASSFYNDYYLVNERSEVASNAHTITGSFFRKDYKGVTEQFAKIQSPGQRERFLAGFSWYKLGDYSKSANLFEEIIEVNKKSIVPLYGDEASYFLALSFLHLRDFEKAYALLREIGRNKNHAYNQTVSPGNISRLWVKKTFR